MSESWPEAEPGNGLGSADSEVPDGPINWLTLGPEEARSALLDLNRWVDFVRVAYGLPPTVIPPFWHRHDELIWELSALHLHWLNAYDPHASLSSPSHWHSDFAAARLRLRDWVATNGTRLDRDRPTRVTAWPGEPPYAVTSELEIANREDDFRDFLHEDFLQRQRRSG